jgi:hypothetical protein
MRCRTYVLQDVREALRTPADMGITDSGSATLRLRLRVAYAKAAETSRDDVALSFCGGC